MRWLLVLVCLSACTASSDVSREIGARCDDSDECDDRCLRGTRFPGGMCSTTCDDDSDCPTGAECTDIEGGICLYDCEQADSCDFMGEGWTCTAEAARGGTGGEVMVCIGQP